MHGKRLLGLCVALGLLMLPLSGDAATYRLPVTTATFAVPFDCYQGFVNGQPMGPYDFHVDPQILQVGLSSGVVYESAIIFDWNELSVLAQGAIANISLHLSTVSPPPYSGGYYMPELFNLDHAVPQPSDFDWWSQYYGGDGESGGVVSYWGFDPRVPDVLISGDWPVHPLTQEHRGWILTTAGSGDYPEIDIAGFNNNLGLEAPYMLVNTVPEPSSALGLGTAILSLGGFLVGARKRRGGWLLAICIVSLSLLMALAALADDWVELNSEPGDGTPAVLTSASMPTDTIQTNPPAGFVILPSVPRLWWSAGCAPTCGAMLAGYYDNSGFPAMCRQKTGRNPDVCTDYLFPTGGDPHDNALFLLSTDDIYLYPSRCDVSATQAGVFGRDADDKGHIDDYVVNYGPPAAAQDNFYTRNIPYAGVLHWNAHQDDCIADFMGASIKWYRNNSDGNSWIGFMPNDQSAGVPSTWVPASYNTSVPPSDPYYGFPNYPLNAYHQIDATYGLARYIAVHAGYHCTTNHATNGNAFDDIAQYYNQTVKGYVSTTNGVVESDIVASVNEGRPVIALLMQVDPDNNYWEMTMQHATLVFGYKQEQAQPLKLLTYDTWREDYLDYETTSYRILDFPTPTQAKYHPDPATNYYSFERGSQSTYWKVFGFAFLKINNNARCPLPLGTNDYPSGTYADEFDINFDLPAGNSHVHYSGQTPTPASSAVTLDANGDGALHVDQDYSLNFRTYRDATPPDGYLASDVVHRVYSVFSANKNIKRNADGASVTMVNGIVTHVVDADNLYIEERDKRLFGIRVHKEGHGLSRDDEVQVVSGGMATDETNSERYVQATSVAGYSTTKVMAPFSMNNKCIGGGDYLPAGGSGTNYGQCGVSGGRGVNNVGLLVRTAGAVTGIDSAEDPEWFTISDGSGVVDADGNEGVRVCAAGLVPSGLEVGDYVSATGISQVQCGNNLRYPVVLARDSDDIMTY